MTTRETDMFETAARTKLRLNSPRGQLTVELLWDVPLRSKDGFDLNTVAKMASAELKAISEESFVDTAKNPAQDRLQLSLDLVKHVIETKLEEEEAAKMKAESKKELEKLTHALGRKQDAKIDEMSEKDLQKEIARLKRESAATQ